MKKTLKLSYDYLKKGGKCILCWTQPFFHCLAIENDKVIKEEPIKENHINYQSSFWDTRKLTFSLTTVIIIAHK